MKLTKFIHKNFGISSQKFMEKVMAGDIGWITLDRIKDLVADEIQKLGIGQQQSRTTDSNRPAGIAIILKSEIDYISRCILDYPHIETGGQLFGYWSAKGVPVVLYAIGPGPRANHESTFFNQDIYYLVQVGKILNERYGLHHIGEWHSHHQLGLAHPSGHDASTMGTSIRNNGLGRSLLCIGNCDDRSSTINAFNFTEECGNDYVHARWLVKESEGIQYRSIIDEELRNTLCHPRTRMARHGQLYLVNQQRSTTQANNVSFAKGYWLTRDEFKEDFKKIYTYFNNGNYCKCTPQMDEQKHLTLCLEYNDRTEYIYFPKDFPEVSPIATQVDKYGYESRLFGQWKYKSNLYETFINYYQSL